ncbi:hypothetical protein COW36_03155 [bacterium (Candidatus Blackallbacteria) CG17_big_fil_post_rev_8_21_14_2_50_48_46]|uniref:Response regulatory domain-containing protein n=1 Tax=bacterium (Candidatus Blackallbacteria) CG17_big_fil_post_rev_8_21_14_2_50_48_46 TaxID=2014261 RepID=A0A2M7G9S5_9BACT|nr:MAG: hypothetical protein COW64_08660 [bacterium (Candidatus Blackallbacteria) CG18_big_fil_WC_8_21_14_2_50_49_26]PIW18854.1 MAG: hypothetical protein COW36_03155 [bacterium (Candidatus Blackallbacteria) CG17_big_fil_post_rev_8_21_14_2_50_48_46]PIW44845.1 MAG: hypothetical protein COW20_22550 [bacterium (Candidatus Blackallbacteria) CG13_big_fil_rev_8_21_14_2_50_49_14]
MQNKTRILLIDDQPTFAKAIEITLSDASCELHTETDSEKGLEKALAETWDLLLLDMHMPKLNGIDFLHRLREAGNQTRVVIMTSDSSLTPVQDIESYHIEAFVLKPIQLHAFSELLEKLVGISLFPKHT